MKYVLLNLMFLLSLTAGACEIQEAQFIGTVKNHSEVQKSESLTECAFEIEFSMFNSSSICPLVIGEVSGYKFPDSNCSMKDGETLSGVLSRRGVFIVIE